MHQTEGRSGGSVQYSTFWDFGKYYPGNTQKSLVITEHLSVCDELGMLFRVC